MPDYLYTIIAFANIHPTDEVIAQTLKNRMIVMLKSRLKQMWKNRIQYRFKSPLQSNCPEFARLFPQGAKLQRVARGFEFTEGPVWFGERQVLLFSDIPANIIYQLSATGEVTVFRKPSHHANGLTRDRQGQLIACEHGTRRVTRTEMDGKITPLAVSFNGKKLNSPNDVVVKSDGAIYFTDPPYGIEPQQQEQPMQGVYLISGDRTETEILLVADDFEKPNGLAFSPDEKTLYVDDSQRRHIRVFDVLENGRLGNSRIFADMNVKEPGLPDGMKCDRQGNLYCTGAAGVWIFNPQGTHLGTILTPEQPSNCAWGDDDGQTLYITAQTSLYKIRVNSPGIPVFPSLPA